MKAAVALAMLQRDDQWLLQLRDDIDTIIYPGHWGCLVDISNRKSASEAVMRELQRRSIGHQPCRLSIGSVTTAETAWPMSSVEHSACRWTSTLNEGQDMKLVSLSDLVGPSSG